MTQSERRRSPIRTSTERHGPVISAQVQTPVEPPATVSAPPPIPAPEPAPQTLLNPTQLYEMFCKDFRIVDTSFSVTENEVHRYGLTVPK